jgi:5-methyltetrahydropteroyltriglutamate--homocysteine methyltransferase
MERTVHATLAGIHPRTEELVQATRDLDRGRATPQQVQEVRRRDAQALVDLQHKAGFADVSDGLLAVQDLFRPFSERVEGLSVGSLTRWFDNNTFYRAPTVTGPLRRKQEVLKPYHEAAKLPAGHAWKAVLPGPYTFAKHAVDEHYGSAERLLSAFARDVLAPEVHGLARQGFGAVQFSEPSLVWERPSQEEWEALQKAYLHVLDGVRITSTVATYFGDARRILTELFELPVDSIGIDLYETDLAAFQGFPATRGLQAGIVDARSSIVERVPDIVGAAQELLEASGAPALTLAPTCELEYVPRGVADEKLLALGEAARALNEEGA